MFMLYQSVLIAASSREGADCFCFWLVWLIPESEMQNRTNAKTKKYCKSLFKQMHNPVLGIMYVDLYPYIFLVLLQFLNTNQSA